VQRVLDQVIRAVEFLFGFTLAGRAGGAVCRRHRHARGAGARVRHHARRGRRASLLRQVQRAELVGVGLLAGFLASCVAVGVGWALARYVFEFSLDRRTPLGAAGGGAGRGACWRWRPAGGACAMCCAARRGGATLPADSDYAFE
jgi:putative ABC transport system permease protein